MKKHELKNCIKAEYRNHTPDIRERVISSCKNEAQAPARVEEATAQRVEFRFNTVVRRVAVCAVCLLIFVAGFSVGFFVPDGQDVRPSAVSKNEAVVYLDVNPSFEFETNDRGRVISCTAVNSDAASVLESLDLDNVDINTALTACVGSMYMQGYLSQSSNTVLISVDADNESKTDELLISLSGKMNSIFADAGMQCTVIAQSVEANDHLREMAEENGVSVGKMYFAEKLAREFVGSDDIDELAAMSLDQLEDIYSEAVNSGIFENDIYSTEAVTYEFGDTEAELETEAQSMAEAESEDVAYITSEIPTANESESRNEAEEEERPPSKPGSKIGDVCPPFEFKSLGSNERFELENNGDRVTVLTFWSMNSEPCIKGLVQFSEIASLYEGRVDVLAVNIDRGEDSVLRWLESEKPLWSNGKMKLVRDEGRACQMMFEMQVCPYTVIIDENGIIANITIGSMTREELILAIDNAIGDFE